MPRLSPWMTTPDPEPKPAAKSTPPGTTAPERERPTAPAKADATPDATPSKKAKRGNKASRPASKRPGHKGAQTRARLLDATLSLVARRGSGAFTVREVVQEASSSLGVLTYHFASRQALLLAAFERHLADQAERSVPIEAKLGDFTAPEGGVDLEALTDAAIDLLTDMIHSDRTAFLLRHELDLEAIRDPELAARLVAAPSAHRRALEEILRAAGSREPALDADLMAAAFEGLGREWLRHPDDRDFDAQIGRSVARLVERFFA